MTNNLNIRYQGMQAAFYNKFIRIEKCQCQEKNNKAFQRVEEKQETGK